jgi:hypothetical protein
MFNVVDQFGMLWDVLGHSEEFYDTERTIRRVEYDRDHPIFLIFYWHGDESNITRRLSIVADAQEFKDITRTYSFSRKVGIDQVFIALPGRVTKAAPWVIEKLISASFLIDHETRDFGYRYETDNGSYIDSLSIDTCGMESYSLYSV